MKKVIQEYKEAVTSPTNYIGLMGYQPTLSNIRDAYQSSSITEEELDQVLVALYQKTQGEPEPFKSKKHMMRTVFGDASLSKDQTESLTQQDQLAAIQSIMGEQKKSTPRIKKEVKPSINVDALPANLRHLVQIK